MARCVVRFKDGKYVNVQADSIIRDNGTVIAWKRVPVEKILDKNAVFETVGVFSEKDIVCAYISEEKEREDRNVV